MKGLSIDEPWVFLIPGGSKTWEMRTTHTQVRGRIALVRNGSGRILGLADVVDSFGPLDDIAWGAHRSQHWLPDHMASARARRNASRILASVVALHAPASCDHPPRALIRVNLDRDAGQRYLKAAQMPSTDVYSITTIPKTRVAPPDHISPVPLPPGTAAPVSDDGTFFGSHLVGSGGFTLAAQGEELDIKNLDDVLTLLRAMPVPRWRPPHPLAAATS